MAWTRVVKKYFKELCTTEASLWQRIKVRGEMLFAVASLSNEAKRVDDDECVIQLFQGLKRVPCCQLFLVSMAQNSMEIARNTFH